MKLKIPIIALLLVMSLTLVSAPETNIGTKQLDDCIDLIQVCADCTYVNFTSFTMPNGTRVIWEAVGTQDGVAFTYYNCSLTSQLGEWIIDGHGDLEGTDTVFAYTYTVTTSGNPTLDGLPSFQMGVIIIIFATACFLLYLSHMMNEPAFKIFFLLASLVFLMATMLTAYMIGADNNVVAGTNSTTLSLVIVLGFVLFIVFIYIMIRQTINALDMLKIKKGLAWDMGNVGGYNVKKPY